MWKATDKSQNKKSFLLLGGQGIGVNNGGSCPKAQNLEAGYQYECSAWRAVASENGYSLMDE